MSVRRRERDWYTVENERRWRDGCNHNKAHSEKSAYRGTTISWEEAELYANRPTRRNKSSSIPFGAAMEQLATEVRRKQ